jgi:hypothetical protein
MMTPAVAAIGDVLKAVVENAAVVRVAVVAVGEGAHEIGERH